MEQIVLRGAFEPLLPFGIPDELHQEEKEDSTVTAEAATKELEYLAEPGRRPDIEKELTEKYHVTWHYIPGAKVSQFDTDKSMHNQARFDPIDPKTVEQYTEGVRRGDPFPAVLAYRPGPRARYVIIDGNHRLQAHAAAEAPIDMYEIDRDTDPKTIALMTFAFNTKHGRPTSEEERIAQALYLVDNGASAEAAATAVSLPLRILRKAIAKSKADLRADEVGVRRNEWDGLAQTVKNRLLNISTDEGFRAAASLAYKAKLDANEVFELVGQLNASKSGTKQVAIVKAHEEVHRDRIQKAAGGVLSSADRRRMTPRGRVAIAISHALNIPEDDKTLLAAYAPPERKEAASNMRNAAERLARLADHLDPIKKK